MSLERRELQGKIAGTKRVRRAAYIGLGVGIVAFFVGLLLQVPVLFLVGYTVFIVCTGIVSFVTVLSWQYNKALRAQVAKKAKPPIEKACPRCGTGIDENEKYCPKCGKKIQSKKR